MASGANPTIAAPVSPGPNPKTSGIKSAPTSGTFTSSQQSAWDTLTSLLNTYGFTPQQLNQLESFARTEIINGSSATQISLQFMQQPAFKARFPAIATLAKEGIAITPAEYISTEQSYAQLDHAAGIPANFTNYNNLIAGQVSPTEYGTRLQQGYIAVAQADPTVVKAMQDYYGVTYGELAAYFTNPAAAAPILEQRALSAQIGGAALQSGFNNPNTPAVATTQAFTRPYEQNIAKPGTVLPEGITQEQALRLAQMGVTQSQAQQGFQTLSKEQQLFAPLPGQGHVGTPPTTDQLLNAQFGSDGQTALELELQAGFEKGTTAQGTNVGTAGTGGAVSNVQR